MELKFRVRDFSKIRNDIRKMNAKLIDKRTEHYIYLKSGNKLQKSKGGYYLVTIKKRKKLFDLKYKKISKKNYNNILTSSEIKRVLNNKRQLYRLNNVEISVNETKIGKFIILDGSRKSSLILARKFGLKNPVTKPFSEL